MSLLLFRLGQDTKSVSLTKLCVFWSCLDIDLNDNGMSMSILNAYPHHYIMRAFVVRVFWRWHEGSQTLESQTMNIQCPN